MRVDLLQRLIYEASQKGIFLERDDTGEDLIVKVLIALLQQKS
jgi:hypothetical protein